MLWHTIQICLSGLKHLFSQLPRKTLHSWVPFWELLLLKEITMPKGVSHFQNWSFWRYKHLIFFPTIWGISEGSSWPQSSKWNGMTTRLQLHHCSISINSALLSSFPSSLLGMIPGNVLHYISCMHTGIRLRICLLRSRRLFFFSQEKLNIEIRT